MQVNLKFSDLDTMTDDEFDMVVEWTQAACDLTANDRRALQSFMEL